jgi:hypothetical protein
MRDARRRLSEVTERKELYTDRDIKGLGKNYMLERSRTDAIDTYTFYIRYYALLGLMKRVASASRKDLDGLLATKTRDRLWEHERRILLSEFGSDARPAELLGRLSEALEKIATDTQESKEKDDVRGARIIDDYAHAHKPAVEDKFVKQTREDTRLLQDKIKRLIEKLGGN